MADFLGMVTAIAEHFSHYVYPSYLYVPDVVVSYHNMSKLLKENYAVAMDSITDEMTGYIDQTLKTLRKALSQDLTKDDLLPCSIRDCLEHVFKYFLFSEGEKDLITLDIKDNFYFMGNDILMIRVLINLIKNALEQIRQHQTGRIVIFCEEQEDYHYVHVKDTAGGASQTIVSTLFSGYTTHKKEGTGIGLAFCQRVINDFGGTIQAHSVEGDYMDIVLALPKAVIS